MSSAPAAAVVTGVDFVSIPTRDLERSVAFYGETLGLERSAYRPDRNHAEFETGTVTLNVIDPERMGIGSFTPNANVIALHVDDVEQARATLTERGVDVRRRHLRHRRLPHGLLRRSRRQRADAPPPLRAAGERRSVAAGHRHTLCHARARRPIRRTLHPVAGQKRVVFLKPLVRHPNVEVGEYTYYDGPDDALAFERDAVLLCLWQ